MDGKCQSGRSGRASDYARRLGWFASGMAVLGVCLLARMYWPADTASAAGKAPAGKTPAGNVRRASASEPARSPSMDPGARAATGKKTPVVAIVNNEPISREDLARECLLHYGNDVLESMVNRTLILTSCKQRNITITAKQIEDEIDRMARKSAVGKDQLLKILETERGIKPARYAKDIIWPTLALRELAKAQLTVSERELDEAYESEFGPSVKVRLIALDNAAEARRVHAEAVAKPDEFPALAKKYSKDPNSASAYGLIQPIRRHSGDKYLEQVAFCLKKGELSKIVTVGSLYVFIKCEEHLPARKGMSREQADPLLTEALKDRKLREAANGVFKQLQQNAQVVIAYNDPAKSKQMPGVAASINGQTITLVELAEECIERNGQDVLEGTINRKLLDQALRKRRLQLTEADLEAEIARAAASMGKVNSDGKPDVAGWLEFLMQAQNISREVYVRDEVWPSVALKKLVGDNVPITQEDLKKGYEANYGPKARCRAIVLNNQRRAQDVWNSARENPTIKHFGDLAEQYSIEASSRSLRGEVPPIQKHGGQPLLEQEAFSLKPGELSGIVQVGDTYVILLCEGYTKPIDTSFEEVKDLLYRDIHEKKLRMAMAKTFEEIKDNARVDNFLTGTSKATKKEEEALAEDPAIPQPKVLKR
jgi:parvulin-like peptidyl-prolyl isomerase